MTYAPPTLRAARALLVDNLDMHPGTGTYPADLDPAEVGIVGDRPHVDGGVSYHLGEDDLDMSANPYSARTARDRAGLSDAASAVDVGEFRITTPLGTFTHRSFAIWLVKQCQANAPDTRDVREVIYSPDGTRVLRYDRERGYASAPREGESDTSHRTHDHVSTYRDAEHRYSLYNLVKRWLTEIGVIDMALKDDPDGRALISRVDSIIDMDDINPVGDSLKPEPNNLGRAIKAIAAGLTALAADVAEIKARPQVVAVPVDQAALDLAVGKALSDLASLHAVAKAVADELHKRTES